MKEADLLRYVTDCATRTGWKVWHVPAPMRATRQGTWVGAKEAAGLPDLLMISSDPPRMILAELKGPKGKLSDEQQTFLKAARRVAIHSGDRFDETEMAGTSATLGVYAWTPDDIPIIESILKSKTLL